jgi:hypothetical protein
MDDGHGALRAFADPTPAISRYALIPDNALRLR